MLSVQEPPERPGLTLGQDEIPELLQRIGVGHLVASFQQSHIRSLQDVHSELMRRQAAEPSQAIQVRSAQLMAQCTPAQCLFLLPWVG